MPVVWHPENEAKLLAGLFKVCDIKISAAQQQELADIMGNGCTAKAVTHRLAKFRKQAGAFNGGKQGGEKAAATATGGGEDGDDDEEVPSPKKKTPAKKVVAKKAAAGERTGKKRKQDDVEGEEDAKEMVKSEEGAEVFFG